MFQMVEQYDNEPSPEVTRIARECGGLNPFGEPNYRVRWGWRCLELRGGEHVDYDENGRMWRREVRYDYWPRYAPKNNRFHLEVWRPAEFWGTPETWRSETNKFLDGQVVAQLGPYPARGDYQLVVTAEDGEGNYVSPTVDAVEEFICRHKRDLDRTSQDIHDGVYGQVAYEKSERRRRSNDILDSEKVAFPWRTWVPVTGASPRQLYS